MTHKAPNLRPQTALLAHFLHIQQSYVEGLVRRSSCTSVLLLIKSPSAELRNRGYNHASYTGISEEVPAPYLLSRRQTPAREAHPDGDTARDRDVWRYRAGAHSDGIRSAGNSFFLWRSEEHTSELQSPM